MYVYICVGRCMLQHTYGGQRSQVCGNCLSSCGNIQIIGCGCKHRHPLSHLTSPKERFLLHRSKSHDLEKLNNLTWGYIANRSIGIQMDCSSRCKNLPRFCLWILCAALTAHLPKPVESFLLGGKNQEGYDSHCLWSASSPWALHTGEPAPRSRVHTLWVQFLLVPDCLLSLLWVSSFSYSPASFTYCSIKLLSAHPQGQLLKYWT